VIHLDTSLIVDLLREQQRGTAGPAHAAVTLLSDDPIGVSVFVLCELEAGIRRSVKAEEERARVRAFVDALSIVYPERDFALAYAGALHGVSAKGRTVATMDLLIGVTALTADAALVTRNRRHFEAIPGLEIVSY
jgi:predicted nucleic acid-binding protein